MPPALFSLLLVLRIVLLVEPGRRNTTKDEFIGLYCIYLMFITLLTSYSDSRVRVDKMVG